MSNSDPLKDLLYGDLSPEIVIESDGEYKLRCIISGYDDVSHKLVRSLRLKESFLTAEDKLTLKNEISIIYKYEAEVVAKTTAKDTVGRD